MPSEGLTSRSEEGGDGWLDILTSRWNLYDDRPSDSMQRQDRQTAEQLPDLDGPDVIGDRIKDFRRRHGMDADDFDVNQRLQLVRQNYEAREAEKTSELLHPDTIPGTRWVSLGPTNGAGRMTAIAVHPTISGTIYAGAAGGGVWKSTDSGVSWVPLTDSITDLSVGALAIAPSSPNTIYLGTGEGNQNGDGIPGIGLLKSTDGGQTWQFPSSVVATNFSKISVHPTNSQELVIGTDSGAYRSTNGGQTWTGAMQGFHRVFDIVRHPSSPQVLYATDRSTGILKSTDGGLTWVAKNNGLPAAFPDRMSIAINQSNPLILFAAGATQDGISHIYKTIDGGETWLDLPGISADPNLQRFFGYQSYYDNTITISPSEPNTVIAGGVFYVKTTDGGATWATTFQCTNSCVHVDAHDLQYQGATLYIANDGGIWSTNDNGQSSTNRNAGLVTRQYYTVANDPVNRNRIFGGTQDNGTNRRLDTSSSNWTSPLGGDGFDCAVNPNSPETAYGTIQYGLIFRTYNAGTTPYFETDITPNYPPGELAAPTGGFYNHLTMDPNNPSVLYTGSYRVWRTTDGGDSWSPLPTTVTNGYTWPMYGPALVMVAPSDSNVLFVIVPCGTCTAYFRSTNGGTTWVGLPATGLPEIGAIFGGREIDPHDPNIIYLTSYFANTSPHVYMSTDGGASWVPRGNGLPAFSTHVIRVDPTDSNVLFCGTDVGVYRSTDRGLNWTRFGTGLPAVSVYDIRIMADGSTVRVATHGRGMWELQIPRVKFDFDGDSKSDLSIFRPAQGEWWVSKSSNGGNFATQFGTSTDTVVPADFTGDGKTDVAYWRPSTGFWYVLRSEDFTFYAFPFGAGGDVPVPADFDGDGKADAGVFRPSAATWYISRSSGGTTIQQFGLTTDKPVPADYDGDGKADLSVYRPTGANGAEWWISKSSGGTFATQFGSSTDKAVPADYTGDGKADVAFWIPSTGQWFILRSEDLTYYAFPFGGSGDAPVPGDYDGDGKMDAAVFRPSNSTWYANRSTAGVLIQQFGQAGDVPLPNAFVR